MYKSIIEDRDKLIVFTAILCDMIIINILFILMFRLYYDASDMIFSRITLLNICYILSIPFGGVGNARRMVRADQVVATALKGSLYFMIIWCVMLSFSRFYITSNQLYLTYFFLNTTLIIFGRLICRKVISRLSNRDRNLCHVVFAGSRESMVELYKEMSSSENLGCRIIGYFDSEPSDRYPPECPYLGDCSSLPEYIKSNSVHRVYCGLSSTQSETMRTIINLCNSNLVRFYRVPELRTLLKHQGSLEVFSNVPILSIRQEPLMRVENRVVKRVFDLLFSSLFLITAFPIILLIFGTLIKLTSKGAIFFSQRRTGIDGREFTCYKFRSMRENCDADRVQATEDDPRKTKVGNFMRRTNIDELPQFWNVFLGDMSIVGPRPHMLKHTTEYSTPINEYMVRHLIKPGITGWAQISGYRGETKTLAEMEGRVKADIWYMEHWSFMLDLYIVYKTIICSFIPDEKAY